MQFITAIYLLGRIRPEKTKNCCQHCSQPLCSLREKLVGYSEVYYIAYIDLFIVCHEVFPPSRLNNSSTNIVGYEQPESASYCVIMIQYGPYDAQVTVIALMETFVPIEREYSKNLNSNTPNIDPMMVRRCRQVAKILSKNSKLRHWYETPEALLADDNRSVTSAHSKRSFFSRNPFNRGKAQGDTFETGSQQSGSTTASFLAPVNVGEQV